MLSRCAFYIVSCVFFSWLFCAKSCNIFESFSCAMLCVILSIYCVSFCCHWFWIRCTTSKRKQGIIFSRLQWRAILKRKDVSSSSWFYQITNNCRCRCLCKTQNAKIKTKQQQQQQQSPFASWWSQSNENSEQSEFQCFLFANICLQRLQTAKFKIFVCCSEFWNEMCWIKCIQMECLMPYKRWNVFEKVFVFNHKEDSNKRVVEMKISHSSLTLHIVHVVLKWLWPVFSVFHVSTAIQDVEVAWPTSIRIN